MSVRVERTGPVTTILLHRPGAKNAVDRDTAHALSRAIDEFEADDGAAVAVLHGEGGTFCAGADLKAVAEGRGNRVAPDGDAPMGLSRLRVDKPTVAAIAGHAHPVALLRQQA